MKTFYKTEKEAEEHTCPFKGGQNCSASLCMLWVSAEWEIRGGTVEWLKLLRAYEDDAEKAWSTGRCGAIRN